jgi:hypothetical protein
VHALPDQLTVLVDDAREAGAPGPAVDLILADLAKGLAR